MRQLKITKSITNRESASLDKYLQEIGREDLITVEEEVELAQAIKRGDRRALEKLTRANLRFVVSVAKQYQNQGLSLPDLINEGNLGLIKAAEKFDETRGFKFISYAVWWIRQSILQALAEQSRIVRLPLNQVGSLNKISKAFSKFEQENERRPSPEELADELDIPVDKISDTLKVSGRHISVDAPFVEGEDNSLLDVLVNDDAPIADRSLMNESLAKEIDRALSDDWVKQDAYFKILDTLRELAGGGQALDMLISNYVYEKEGERRKKVIQYRHILPVEKMFTWTDCHHFLKGHYILMHSVIFRTRLLQECGLKLPEHTFYVDNLYVFEPLPYVKNMYYLDVNFYRYYIGRQDQSVNETVMISRNACDLLEKGILSQCKYGVKILGEGNLTKKLTVRASAFSASAKAKIEEAGGKAEVV